MLLGIFILPDNFISASSTSFCAGRLSRVTVIHADYIISADKNSLCLKSVESLWNRIAMVKRLAVGSRLVYFRGGKKKVVLGLIEMCQGKGSFGRSYYWRRDFPLYLQLSGVMGNTGFEWAAYTGWKLENDRKGLNSVYGQLVLATSIFYITL